MLLNYWFMSSFWIEPDQKTNFEKKNIVKSAKSNSTMDVFLTQI